MENQNDRAHTTDMTQGNPLRLILRFALPVLLGNCFQLIYSMVDTFVAGHFLGEGAIAAIGATSVIYSLIMNFTWGLNGGYCIVLARVFGSGNEKRLSSAVAVMFVLNIAAAAVFTVASLVALSPVMVALKTPEAIFLDAYKYIAIIISGLLATLCYNMACGFMNALGNSRIPLYFLIFSSLLNVVLDVAFVALLRLGIAGLSFATVIAQATSAALSLFYIRKNYPNLLPKKSEFSSSLKNKSLFLEMLSSGFSMALMYSVVGLGTVALQRAINLLGTDYIAAHTASRKLFDLLMMPLSTLAIANGTFASQNYGAHKLERIRNTIRMVLCMEFTWSMVSVAIAFLGGRGLASWLTGSKKEIVVSSAALYLRFATLFFFPLGSLFVLRYAMQSLGHRIVPVFSSSIELTLKLVFSFFVVPLLGYWGVVITEPIIWAVCAVMLFVFYEVAGKPRNEL